MTKQIETATVIAAAGCTGNGNATVTVTASGMNNSPKAISVPLTTAQNSAALVAQEIRYALAIDADVSSMFLVSGTGANIILTARLDAANDTTFNIATANGTCSGLTAAPTSTNTLAGVATITNGYCTQAEAKAYGFKSPVTDTTDDTVIDMLIEAASRYIDQEAQQVFYTTTETRKFDLPKGDLLMLDKPLMSITSITNGDGEVIPSTNYITWPANELPLYGIQILSSMGIGWKRNSNTPLQCIEIVGSWGIPCPAQIKEACLLIFKAAYNRRFGENMTSTTTITQGGIVITPEDVPAKAFQIIHNSRRVSFG